LIDLRTNLQTTKTNHVSTLIRQLRLSSLGHAIEELNFTKYRIHTITSADYGGRTSSLGRTWSATATCVKKNGDGGIRGIEIDLQDAFIV